MSKSSMSNSPTRQALIASYRLDGAGKGDALTWDQIQQWPQQQTGQLLWIHLNFSMKETVDYLHQHLPSVVVEALCAKDSRPRSFIYEDGLFLSLRGVNLAPGSFPEDMVSIRVWATRDFIISTQRRPLKAVMELQQSIEKGHGPIDPNDFMVMLSYGLIDHTVTVINGLAEKIDHIEKQIEQSPELNLRNRLMALRRQVTIVRRFMSPQRDALVRLSSDRLSWMEVTNIMQFREVADQVTKLIEDLDQAKDRLSILQESLTTSAQEQLNNRMYLLAIIAGIFLPLTFITGLLGINVGGIPFNTWHYGFVTICGILALLVILLLFFFKRRRWF